MKICISSLLLALATSNLSAQWIINEIHADPAANAGAETPGDANGDGTRHSSEDEFIELINNTGASVDIENWVINDFTGLRHSFVGSTVVADGQVVLVFGGGTPTGTFGGAIVQISSEGLLGFNNSGDSITLADASGASVVFYEYFGEGGNNQSLTRDPDITGAEPLVEHSTAAGANGALFSPGTKVDGNPFAGDSLTVTVDPATFSEGAGAGAAIGTVTRAGDLSAALTVNLASNDDTELTVPASVMIGVGQASATFGVDAVDDGDQDASQLATITASADGVFSGNITVTVEDDEAPIPTISVEADPASISENGGLSTITVTISASSPTGYSFDVIIDDFSELSGPSTVDIAANQTTATFTVNGVDDAEVDGSRSVQIIVADPNVLIESSSVSVVVTDDEAFAAPDLVINELRTDNSGVDTQEYLEIYGAAPDYSLNRLWLIVLGDLGGNDASGNVDRAYDLGGNTATGNYFLIANDGIFDVTADYSAGTNIFENNDSITFLLVTDFTGATNTDLDTDNDGVLDSMPWGSILDAVSIIQPGDPAVDGVGYATSLGFMNAEVTSDDGFTPAHVLRSPSGTGAWVRGPFGSAEVPAVDTPGAENSDTIKPPVTVDPEILILTVNGATGVGEMVVTGLGVKTFNIEFTDDLNQASPWTVLAAGYTEADNPDGTVSFSFTDAGVPATGTRFYRIIEVR